MDYDEYKVQLYSDPETGHVIAEVPALGIADWGSDVDAALHNIREMVSFHLECLVEEGRAIPQEADLGEGVYVRVKHPAHAA